MGEQSNIEKMNKEELKDFVKTLSEANAELSKNLAEAQETYLNFLNKYSKFWEDFAEMLEECSVYFEKMESALCEKDIDKCLVFLNVADQYVLSMKTFFLNRQPEETLDEMLDDVTADALFL